MGYHDLIRDGLTRLMIKAYYYDKGQKWDTMTKSEMDLHDM